ncbi:MAG: DUF1992 domain-containing protein [Myxococcota bacterium]
MDRFESAVEQMIQAAMRQGDFDHLPGKGKPIEDLDQNDPDWWIKKKMKDEGVDGVPPVPSLALRAELPGELARIRALTDERQMRAELILLNKRIRAVNSRQTKGPSSNALPVDIDAFVAKARADRS